MKIIDQLFAIPLDKQAHFWSGLALTLALALFFGPGWALVGCLAAGLAKELRDQFSHGQPDLWDFLATALGGSVAVLLYVLDSLMQNLG